MVNKSTMNLPIEILVHILKIMPFTDMVETILVSKKFLDVISDTTWHIKIYYMKRLRDYKIATSLKLVINELRIYPKFKCSDINLTNLNYKKLFFDCVDFSNVNNFRDIDSEISQKCKKLKISKFKNYSDSLMGSFDVFQECTNIWIQGMLDINDVYRRRMNKSPRGIIISKKFYLFMKRIKTLPKLCNVYLDGWVLYDYHLNLLNGYENVTLNKMWIIGDLRMLDHNSHVCITNSLLNNHEKITKNDD